MSRRATTAAPRPERSLFEQLLADGIPSTLLIDLLDPEGMRIALAAELAERDVALAPAPSVAPAVRTIRSA